MPSKGSFLRVVKSRDCVVKELIYCFSNEDNRYILLFNPLPHYRILMHYICAVENIVPKGEIGCNKLFLLFSQYFLPYMVLILHFNLLPDVKISDWSKLKAFADNKLSVTQNVKVVFHRIEDVVDKEENAGYQLFLLLPQYFQKAFSFSVSKVVIVW